MVIEMGVVVFVIGNTFEMFAAVYPPPSFPNFSPPHPFCSRSWLCLPLSCFAIEISKADPPRMGVFGWISSRRLATHPLLVRLAEPPSENILLFGGGGREEGKRAHRGRQEGRRGRRGHQEKPKSARVVLGGGGVYP